MTWAQHWDSVTVDPMTDFQPPEANCKEQLDKNSELFSPRDYEGLRFLLKFVVFSLLMFKSLCLEVTSLLME